MDFSYLLLILIPIGGVGYVLWDHKRKVAAREAASAGRLQEILGAVQQAGVEGETNTPADASAENPPAAAPAPPAYVRRERVLNPAQTLLYYLLRTAMPDYLVFAQMPLSALLDPGPALSGYARDETSRRLALRSIDCVVSDRRMRPVVAVQLSSPQSAATNAASSPAGWLAAAGVRYVELDPAALPRKEAIREVVLGESAARAGGESGAPFTAG
ncbi:MAG: DUF2726 domain-containing protein [Burkholderiales bacterium]